jgi:hypothetical protein
MGASAAVLCAASMCARHTHAPNPHAALHPWQHTHTHAHAHTLRPAGLGGVAHSITGTDLPEDEERLYIQRRIAGNPMWCARVCVCARVCARVCVSHTVAAWRVCGALPGPGPGGMMGVAARVCAPAGAPKHGWGASRSSHAGGQRTHDGAEHHTRRGRHHTARVAACMPVGTHV